MRFRDMPKRFVCILALMLSFMFAMVWVTSPQCSAEEGEYDFTVKRDIMVPMRDGVKLATDIYLPTEDGDALDERLPVILRRTPYNKETAESYARYFTSYGLSLIHI